MVSSLPGGKNSGSSVAYAGIRNVVAHSPQPGWSEQQAVEYLGVLSTVARWSDETEVFTRRYSLRATSRRGPICDPPTDPRHMSTS
jgi:hypothetical protein